MSHLEILQFWTRVCRSHFARRLHALCRCPRLSLSVCSLFLTSTGTAHGCCPPGSGDGREERRRESRVLTAPYTAFPQVLKTAPSSRLSDTAGVTNSLLGPWVGFSVHCITWQLHWLSHHLVRDTDVSKFHWETTFFLFCPSSMFWGHFTKQMRTEISYCCRRDTRWPHNVFTIRSRNRKLKWLPQADQKADTYGFETCSQRWGQLPSLVFQPKLLLVQCVVSAIF